MHNVCIQRLDQNIFICDSIQAVFFFCTSVIHLFESLTDVLKNAKDQPILIMITCSPSNLPINLQISDAEWEDMLEGFDERSYLNARRWKPGDDPYTLYAFNQRESERIPSDRVLRDTRHYRYMNRQVYQTISCRIYI